MHWIKCTATVNSKCKLTSSEANVCESLFKRNILFFSLVSDNVTIMKSKHIKRCFSVSLVSKHFFITLFGPNEHQGRLGRRLWISYRIKYTVLQFLIQEWFRCKFVWHSRLSQPSLGQVSLGSPTQTSDFHLKASVLSTLTRSRWRWHLLSVKSRSTDSSRRKFKMKIPPLENAPSGGPGAWDPGKVEFWGGMVFFGNSENIFQGIPWREK